MRGPHVRSARQELLCREAQSTLGRGYHLHPDLGGVSLLSDRSRCLLQRVVGWAMGTNLKTQLVLDAMNMAMGQRKPRDVIYHSDQGSQGGFNLSSIAFGLRCKEAGVRPSMGSVGDAYDNAMCESSSPRSNASCSTGGLPHQGPGAHGYLRVRRRLVQSRPSTLSSGILVTDRL